MTRISHDQLMKQALQERFADFVRLFDPDTAAAVETYLPVAAQDRAAWRQHLETEGGDIMALEATELTWRSRVDLEATVRTRREDIRKVVQARFGRVSPEMEAVIAGTEAEEAMNALFDQALAAQTEIDLRR